MELQKKRSSLKKSKQNKTQTHFDLPLAPLLHQINQLKSQLATIKSPKKLKPSKQIQKSQQKLSPKGQLPFALKASKSQNNFPIYQQNKHNVDCLKFVVFPNAEKQEKLNYMLSLLSLNIQNNGRKCIYIVNDFIEFLNACIADLSHFSNSLPLPLGLPVESHATLFSSLTQLEKQNIQYKHLITKQMVEIEELKIIGDKYQEQCLKMGENMGKMEEEIGKMGEIIAVLREQRRENQEKMRVYERVIEKKEGQIVMFEEDVNFCRIQNEKNKTQKRQLQKMFDNLQKQHRQQTQKYLSQLQSLKNQKNKWKSQCQARRFSQSQSLSLQQIVTQLKSQLSCLRQSNLALNEQLSQLKITLSQKQKQSLVRQQQNFHLRMEKEKIGRNAQYYKYEIKELGKQVQELREEAGRYRDMVVKGKIGGIADKDRQEQKIRQKQKQREKDKGEKGKALQEIQDLIKRYKNCQNGQIF